MVADTILYCHTKNLRRQAKALFVWYPKEQGDLKVIHNENDVPTDDELFVARGLLWESRYGCLYIRNKYPREFMLVNHV